MAELKMGQARGYHDSAFAPTEAKPGFVNAG